MAKSSVLETDSAGYLRAAEAPIICRNAIIFSFAERVWLGLDAVLHSVGTAPREPLPVDQVHSTLDNSLSFGLLPDLSYVTQPR